MVRKQIQLAVIAPSRPHDFFDLIWQGIWSAAFELSQFGVKVESYETQSHDVLAQRRLLKELEESPPAAIALIPAHKTALNNQLNRFTAIGVPVVTFNADALGSRRTTYVGTDPSKSGALAGELLSKIMHGVGSIVSFPGLSETEHLKQRHIAFRAELKRSAPLIQESVYQSDSASLEEAADSAFSGRVPADAIYVGNSQVHLVAAAMERHGLRVPCVGFDDTPANRPYLKRGTVSAVIDEQPYQQGYLAVQQAYWSIGESRNERFSRVEIPATVVFSANANVVERTEVPHGAFELMMQQRTQKVVSYQKLLAEANARIASMADTDPLTGLINRRRFEEILDLRSKDQNKLSLLIVGMKNQVAQATEESLINLAKVLSAHSRPSDYCARLSSDEFGLLMPDAGPAQAGEIRRRILAALKKMLIAPQTLKLHLQASIGLASMPADAQNVEDLLILADNAMYAHRRSSL